MYNVYIHKLLYTYMIYIYTHKLCVCIYSMYTCIPGLTAQPSDQHHKQTRQRIHTHTHTHTNTQTIYLSIYLYTYTHTWGHGAI